MYYDREKNNVHNTAGLTWYQKAMNIFIPPALMLQSDLQSKTPKHGIYLHIQTASAHRQGLMIHIKSLSLQLQLKTSIYLPIYVLIYVHPLQCTVTRAYINCCI